MLVKCLAYFVLLYNDTRPNANVVDMDYSRVLQSTGPDPLLGRKVLLTGLQVYKKNK